jgi:hypothetical protein
MPDEFKKAAPSSARDEIIKAAAVALARRTGQDPHRLIVEAEALTIGGKACLGLSGSAGPHGMGVELWTLFQRDAAVVVDAALGELMAPQGGFITLRPKSGAGEQRIEANCTACGRRLA